MKLVSASLFGLIFILTGCVTNSGSEGMPSERYLLYLSCVDSAATVHFEKGQTLENSINDGVSECESRLNAYVAELIENTKSRNGWSSVESSVEPAVRNGVIKNTHAKLRPVYEDHKRGR